MCSSNIIEGVAAGAATGALLALPTGGLSVLAGAAIGAGAGLASSAGAENKGPLRKLLYTKPIKPPEKPKDLTGQKKREAARAVRRTLSGRPGAGRSATIFSRGGGGTRNPTGLKDRTGQ